MDATHSHMKLRMAEVKFDEDWTIYLVKDHLEKRFGTAVGDQSLQLKNFKDELICEMADDNKKLKDYGAANGYLIHVLDSNPNATMGQYDDVS